MKKKILSLLLAICMVLPMSFSLVACGDEEDKEPSASQTSTEQSSDKESTMTSENITLGYTSTVYDGTEKEPSVVLTYDDEVVSSDNYSVAYSNNIDAGIATVVVTSNDNSEVLEAGLSFTTTFKIERHPIFVETTNQLNAAIQVSDKNHVVRLAKNINDRKADGKINPITILPLEKNYDLYIDLAGYDLNSYFDIRSKDKTTNVETDKVANITIYNSSTEESVVGAFENEVDYAIQIMTNNNYNINLENVKFQGYWGGIATNGLYISETVVNAKYCEFIGIKTSASSITDTSVGAYLPASKYLYNFTDCEFSGFTGYYAKAGHHNLIGCEVNGVGEFAFNPPVINPSGCNATGSALIVDACEDYDKGALVGYASALTVNISGGRYVSRANYALQQYCTYNETRECYAQIYVVNEPILSGFDSETNSYSFEDETCVHGLTVAHKHTYRNENDIDCDVCFAKRETANYNIWSGFSDALPEAVENVIVITTAEELAGLAKAVNLGTDFKGITIKLAADIDLANFEWAPIGYGPNAAGFYFNGTFDGQNHTIYNLKITTFVGGSSYEGAASGVGLFGHTHKNAVIKNVKIDGAVVSGNHYVGSLVGYAYSSTIDSCAVSNAVVNCIYLNDDDSGDKAGAVIGHAAYGRANNISATNSSVGADRDAGQVVGCIANTAYLTNLSATNVVVTPNGTGTGDGENVRNEVLGRDAATLNYWDGSVGTLPEAVENVITIRYAEELAALAKAVNEGNDFAGYTIVLSRNFDLMNIEWTPIGFGGGSAYKAFSGTFDGQGKTIYNLKITTFVGGSTHAEAASGVGLFGQIKYATIKNVKIDTAEVRGNHYVGALVGYAYDESYISDCSVKNAQVYCTKINNDDEGDKAAVVVGYVMNSTSNGKRAISYTSIVKNCSITKSKVYADRDAGYIVGCISSRVAVVGCSAKTSNVIANEGAVATNMGKRVVGRDLSSVSLWDGTIGTVPAADSKNVIKITTAAEFAAFAKAVNDGNNFAGYTIKLEKDIDLANIEWTPIGYGFSNFSEVTQTGASFRGIFDGQNHFVLNLKVTEFIGGGKLEGTTTGVGLFGHIVAAEIKNVKVAYAQVVGNHYVGIIAGFSLNSKIEACVVDRAAVSCIYADADESGDKAGIIVGQFARTKNATAVASIKNCRAVDCTVDADRDAGRIIGCLDNDPTQTGNSATRVEVSCNNSGAGKSEKTGTNITNGIVGRVD